MDANIRLTPVIKGETKPSGNTAKLLDPLVKEWELRTEQMTSLNAWGLC